MTRRAVCPCCGSEVADDVLSDEQTICDLRSVIPLTPREAQLFLLLWKNRGRVVHRETVFDWLDRMVSDHNKVTTYWAVNNAMQRLRRSIQRHRLPLDVASYYSSGYMMSCSQPGWHWREEPTTLQRQIAADEFQI